MRHLVDKRDETCSIFDQSTTSWCIGDIGQTKSNVSLIPEVPINNRGKYGLDIILIFSQKYLIYKKEY